MRRRIKSVIIIIETASVRRYIDRDIYIRLYLSASRREEAVILCRLDPGPGACTYESFVTLFDVYSSNNVVYPERDDMCSLETGSCECFTSFCTRCLFFFDFFFFFLFRTKCRVIFLLVFFKTTIIVTILLHIYMTYIKYVYAS